MKKNNTLIKTLITLSIVGIVFYVFNLMTPIYADDHSYSFSFATGKRIVSFFDIFPSLKAHYFKTNGRMVTHFFAQLFLLLGKDVFNIINAAAFLGLGLLIWQLSGINKKHSLWFLVSVYIMLYWFTPDFGQSFLWVDGAATYLYGPVIALLLLLPYKAQIKSEIDTGLKKSVLLSLPLFLFGMIAAGTVENIGASLIIVTGILSIYSIHKRKKASIWMSAGFFGTISGTLFLVISPGTSSRLETVGGIGGIGSFVWRGMDITASACQYLTPLALVTLFLLIFYILKNRWRNINEWQELYPFFIFVIAMITSIYSMIIAPFFPQRAWSICIIYAIITLGNLISVMNFDKDVKMNIICVVTLATICTLGSCYKTFWAIKQTNDLAIQRIEQIKKQKAEGKKDIYVSAIRAKNNAALKYSPYTATDDLEDDAKVWPNTSIAKYYGVKSINKIKE